MDKTSKVSGIIRGLREEMGSAVPVDIIKRRCLAADISLEEMQKSLDKLEMDGMLTKLDEKTIGFL